MNTLSSQHPYWCIKKIIESNERVKTINFSYYEYTPQSLVDNRTNISISKLEFLDPDLIKKIINSTPQGKELSLHSTIETDSGETFHIPMIDMSTGSLAQLEKVRPLLGDSLFSTFSWFKSGRSYHGYGSTLIDQKEWISQMGRLLLVNQIGLPPTVDPRWVGHRLIAGYSSLRWTNNTSHYINIPKKI